MGTGRLNISRLADPGYHGHSVSVLQRLAEALGMDLQVRLVPRAEDKQRAS